MITIKRILMLAICCMALYTPANDLQASAKSRSRTLTNKQLYIGGAIIAGAIAAIIVTRMLWKRGWFSKKRITPNSGISTVVPVLLPEPPRPTDLPLVDIKDYKDKGPMAYLEAVINMYKIDRIDYEHLEYSLWVLVNALNNNEITSIARGEKLEASGTDTIDLSEPIMDFRGNPDRGRILAHGLNAFKDHEQAAIKVLAEDRLGKSRVLLEKYSLQINIPKKNSRNS